MGQCGKCFNINRLRLVLSLATAVVSAAVALAEVTPDQAVAQLMQGHERYKSAKFKERDYTGQRDEQKASQHPYAIVLSCSDSRVPPEIIFDEDLGQLFVVRVAGNVIDSVTLGSVEYAAEHLHVPLVVVIGHTKCGAVTAALAGGKFSEPIGEIVRLIQPAAETAKAETREETRQLPLAVRDNVFCQMAACVKKSAALRELAAKGGVKVVGGIYDIETGVFQLYPEDAAKEGMQKFEKLFSEEKPSGEKADGAGGGTGGGPPSPAGGDASGEYLQARERPLPGQAYTDGKLFCVQVVAVRTREAADEEADKLRKKGLAVIVQRTEVRGGWYRVRVGYFHTLAEARAAAGKAK